MSGWNFVVNTGNPAADHQTVEGYRQTYEAQGMSVQVYPLPTGGHQVVIQPQQAPPAQAPYQQPGQHAHAQQPQYQQPPQHEQPGQYGHAQPAAQQHAYPQQQEYPQQQAAAYGGVNYAMAGGAAVAAAAYPSAAYQPTGAPAGAGSSGGAVENQVADFVGAPRIESARIAYLRKVYGLLGAAAFLAVGSGFASVTLGPTVPMVSPEGLPAQVPLLTSILLGSEVLMYAAFGVLFVATIAASWVSKVPYLNVAALMGVAVLMGIELAPMVFVAQFYSGMGATLSASPVRDAGVMVMCVFVGITGYVFITRKDFSYLYSILSMGVMVVFGACILAIFVGSEPFSLAVASVGALVAAGMLLYVTSYIFRNSEMDDAVGDALALLVQLRNLFMFLLRIFMSRR